MRPKKKNQYRVIEKISENFSKLETGEKNGTGPRIDYFQKILIFTPIKLIF